MADADDKQTSAQLWGSAMVVGSALAVVAAYLINGALLVLAVAGVETLLLMVYVARRWRALHGGSAPVRHRPRRGGPDAAHCERCRRAREALDARQARARSAGSPRESYASYESPGSYGSPGSPGSHGSPESEGSHGPYGPHGSHDPHRQSHGEQHHAHGEQHGELHHAHGPLLDQGSPSESGAADHGSYPRRPQIRAPYERPWTAERAAVRSVDRATARRGAPGSAGRAVRHQ
ncbi:hypothetical protein AB0E96_30420 [Kitasatospora sp. NPDC036755]|uniref:hypothetical protein n=1 Tax=Kitasatospora sp. NPDC036755 TaxID=3154600 RepID=UPI0033C358F6